MVEGVQRGLRSRLYDRGRYAPSHEQAVHHFHREWLARLQEREEARSETQPLASTGNGLEWAAAVAAPGPVGEAVLPDLEAMVVGHEGIDVADAVRPRPCSRRR